MVYIILNNVPQCSIVFLQSVPIITKVVSSNPAHGEVNSIQHYVLQFVSDLWQVGGLSEDTPISSSNKIHRHDATEILLKVTLNNITLTPLITSVWQQIQYDMICCISILLCFTNWLRSLPCLFQFMFSIGTCIQLQVRVITVFTVFRLLTDFVCLYTYEF